MPTFDIRKTPLVQAIRKANHQRDDVVPTITEVNSLEFALLHPSWETVYDTATTKEEEPESIAISTKVTSNTNCKNGDSCREHCQDGGGEGKSSTSGGGTPKEEEIPQASGTKEVVEKSSQPGEKEKRCPLCVKRQRSVCVQDEEREREEEHPEPCRSPRKKAKRDHRDGSPRKGGERKDLA